VETCSILLRCPILAGGSTFQRNLFPPESGDEWVYENSVLLFDATGPSETEYAKINLVPFSEYVPFKRDWPALHRALRQLVPELMPQIQPGKELTRFELVRNRQQWQIATPICFEGTFARLCRELVEAGPKDKLLLANLSNDGWFVYQPKQGPPRGTTAHTQHLVHSVFRAVENRTPVLRAVNTGISAFVSSDGTIQSQMELRIDEYRKRTMVAGVLEGKTLVDRRRSLYSLYGDVFACFIGLPALGIALVLLFSRRAHRKES
jgi:apolipoprotein N-acyltransferase